MIKYKMQKTSRSKTTRLLNYWDLLANYHLILTLSLITQMQKSNMKYVPWIYRLFGHFINIMIFLSICLI